MSHLFYGAERHRSKALAVVARAAFVIEVARKGKIAYRFQCGKRNRIACIGNEVVSVKGVIADALNLIARDSDDRRTVKRMIADFRDCGQDDLLRQFAALRERIISDPRRRIGERNVV